MTHHDDLIRELLVERFGSPMPPEVSTSTGPTACALRDEFLTALADENGEAAA